MSPEEIVREWILERKRQDGTTLRAVAASTGISRAKLSNIGRPGVSASVSVSDAITLSKFFGKEIAELFPSQTPKLEENTNRPAFEDVLAWMNNSGLELDASHRFYQLLMLTSGTRASDDNIQIVSVGQESLTAKAVQTTSPKIANSFVHAMDLDARRTLVENYSRTIRQRSVQVFNRDRMPTTHGATYRYVTALAPCRLEDGSTGVANFSTLISDRPNGIASVADS